MKKIRIILNLNDSRLLFNLGGIESTLSKYGEVHAYPASNLKTKEATGIVIEIDSEHEYVKTPEAFENVSIRTNYLNEMSKISLDLTIYTFKKLVKNGSICLPINSYSVKRLAEITNKNWKNPVGVCFDLEDASKDLDFDFFSYEVDDVVKIVSFVNDVDIINKWEKEVKKFAKATASKINIINVFEYDA